MRVLFFGSQGWIGKQFTEVLKECGVHVIETSTRADDELRVERDIIFHAPTHLVCFVGRTHGEGINTIDYLEKPGKLRDNLRDNLYSPAFLAMMAFKYDLHMTYLGTGCIFSSSDPENSNYTEEDAPDFFGSSYSTVKGFTDRFMHILPKTVLNLRIRMPITDFMHDRNFITKLVKYEKICSIPNSMTVLHDMFPIIHDMMSKHTTGTFNMTNPGIISHDEVLGMYREIVDPEFTWTNFSSEEQGKVIKSERSNNQLSNDKLLSLYPLTPNIADSVKTCMMAIKTKRDRRDLLGARA